MDKQFKDFNSLTSDDYKPNEDFFILPGDGADTPTSLIIVNKAIDNFQTFKKIQPVKPDTCRAIMNIRGTAMESASPVIIVDENLRPSNLNQSTDPNFDPATNITTYNIESLGLPPSATAAYLKIFMHAGHQNLDFSYYTNGNGTGGHVVENYQNNVSPRADVHTWFLWVPAEQSNIYINWRGIKGTNPHGSSFQVLLNSYL